MDIKKLFPSKFLSAGDLGSRRFTLLVRDVRLEKLGNPAEDKPVLYFQKAEKGLVLNRTNALAIASAYGDETEGWTGKPVILFATKVKAFGRWQDAGWM